LVRLLKACDIRMAAELGLQAVQNGKLLAAAEAADFDVLLSSDKSIKDELVMAGRKIGIVSMSDNHWPTVGEFAGAIMQAIEKVKPGQVLPVFCGQFSRGKARRNPRLS
jgi:ABC-type tungstate transport system permease subunit